MNQYGTELRSHTAQTHTRMETGDVREFRSPKEMVRILKYGDDEEHIRWWAEGVLMFPDITSMGA